MVIHLSRSTPLITIHHPLVPSLFATVPESSHRLPPLVAAFSFATVIFFVPSAPKFAKLNDSHRRDARHSSLTDDRRAAGTAHKVCTVLRKLTLSTSSQTSTLVRSPTQHRCHSTGAFHPAKCQESPQTTHPKYPNIQSSRRQCLTFSKTPLRAHKPHTQNNQAYILPVRAPTFPANLEPHNSASHKEQTWPMLLCRCSGTSYLPTSISVFNSCRCVPARRDQM